MKIRKRASGFTYAVVAAIFMLAGISSAGYLSNVPGAEERVSGGVVRSWARVDYYNKVSEAGVTLPFDLIKDPPSQPPETGPRGAVTTLEFPLVVGDTTFLEHFELHYRKRGQGTDLFRESHFGLRFCSFPVAEFLKITSPDPKVPAKSRIPPGFTYPGPGEAVYQVGTRAMRPGDIGKKSDYVLTVGFYDGNLMFIEPVVKREFLLRKSDFELDIPMPAALGYEAYYPIRFRASYDAATDSYSFVFSRFRNIRN